MSKHVSYEISLLSYSVKIHALVFSFSVMTPSCLDSPRTPRKPRISEVRLTRRVDIKVDRVGVHPLLHESTCNSTYRVKADGVQTA